MTIQELAEQLPVPTDKKFSLMDATTYEWRFAGETFGRVVSTVREVVVEKDGVTIAKIRLNDDDSIKSAFVYPSIAFKDVPKVIRDLVV